jgi:hypothetical protein
MPDDPQRGLPLAPDGKRLVGRFGTIGYRVSGEDGLQRTPELAGLSRERAREGEGNGEIFRD